MSADTRIAKRLAETLASRVGGDDARGEVRLHDWRSRWCAHGTVRCAAGAVYWQPEARHTTKREALRALADLARVPWEGLIDEVTS